jgi:hypothetical protein
MLKCMEGWVCIHMLTNQREKKENKREE